MGALSANTQDRESALKQRQSLLNKEKTDQTEKTFAKESFEHSNYSTKKHSDDNLKVLSPQLINEQEVPNEG